MVKTKKPKRKNNTTKKRGGSMFGYVTGVDNNLVTLSCNDKSIQCSICNNPQFQFRNGTVGKSKTQAVLFSFVSDETQLNDTSKARVIYEQVIQKYPNTQFAIDSKASIDNLGKTPEQLIKEFEAKNKKK